MFHVRGGSPTTLKAACHLWRELFCSEEDGEMMGGEEGEECDEVMTGGEEVSKSEIFHTDNI